MPVHDWTRVDFNAFHGFHLAWYAAIHDRLNIDLLPRGFYAQLEPVPPLPGIPPAVTPAKGMRHRSELESRTDLTRKRARCSRPKPWRRRLVIRSEAGHGLVSILEVATPGLKYKRTFAPKVVETLKAGVHVTLVDILSAGPHDPDGMHAAVWGRLRRNFTPTGPTRAVVGYACDPPDVTAYVGEVTVGEPLPDVPLFVSGDYFVSVPLEAAYGRAYEWTPWLLRGVLDQS